MSNAFETYARVGVETAVAAANPHKLMLLVFQAAVLSLSKAQHAIERKDVQGRTKAINKAIELIHGGLRASLDKEKGGEIAQILDGLYDYMVRQLMRANLRNDVALVIEVKGLLDQIKAAWEAIAPQASA